MKPVERILPGAEERRYLMRREAMTRSELVDLGCTETELRTWPRPRAVHGYVLESNGTQRRLTHIVLHSPTGLEYGYGGLGPADLARSILVDFFELHHAPDELPVSYQQFKRAFIEPADHGAERLEIAGAAIADWVRSQPPA
jgi:hypothetical protein